MVQTEVGRVRALDPAHEAFDTRWSVLKIVHESVC